MQLDEATVERFVRRIIESETVFYLSHEDGVAHSISDNDELTGVEMFWSDRAYATRANFTLLEYYSVSEMELFNLLFHRLPGMSVDGVLAGLDWIEDELDGGEIDPLELKELVENILPIELTEKYKTKYNEHTKTT